MEGSFSVIIKWFVPVTIFQILTKGVLVVLAEAGSTEQATEETEAEATVDPGLAKSVT